VVRAACGYDLAIVPQRQIGHVDMWCGHRDVAGRITPNGVEPVKPEDAYRCDCRRH
jgi:hypothetical protein